MAWVREGTGRGGSHLISSNAQATPSTVSCSSFTTGAGWIFDWTLGAAIGCPGRSSWSVIHDDDRWMGLGGESRTWSKKDCVLVRLR